MVHPGGALRGDRGELDEKPVGAVRLIGHDMKKAQRQGQYDEA